MNSLTREGKFIVFGGIILIIVVAIGIYWWQRGDALLVQPPSDLPNELAETFQTELTSRGIGKVGHPIEGFDAFLLMEAFPGLHKEDFGGVQSLEGVYSYKNNELVFRRMKSRLSISTAEKTVSREGYKTLLENLSRRLNVPLQDTRSIPLIIDSLGGVFELHEEKLTACKALPNNSIQKIVETSRLFINLPKDVYPYENIGSNFVTVSGNATAGWISNGGLPGQALEATPECWSTYFELDGNGEVDLMVKSAVKGVPDYFVRFIVIPTQ